MVEQFKDILFTTTTLGFIGIYSIDLFLSVYIIKNGIKILDNFWYNVIIFLFITTFFTLIAGFDWLINKQYMHIDYQTNFIWFWHHSLTSFSFCKILLYFQKKIRNDKYIFNNNIKKILQKTYISTN